MIAYYTVLVVVMSVLSLVILWPWIEESAMNAALRDKENPLDRFQELHQQRELYFENLKELELDLQMGKLIDTDHQRMKKETLNRILKIDQEIQTIEKESVIFQEIEKDRLALKEQST